MSDLQERLLYLLEQYIKDQCTDAETDELFEIILLPQNEFAVKTAIGQAVIQIEKQIPDSRSILNDNRAEEIFKVIIQSRQKKSSQGIIQPLFNKWLSLVAIFLLVVFTAGIVYVMNYHQPTAPVVKANTQRSQEVNPPVAMNAVITLSNGERIVLDSIKAGVIHAQGHTNIVKSPDGRIIYNAGLSFEPVYNTLYVPRGSKIVNIVLSDGSRVWLNSASTLKYPVAFSGNERKVEIDGEAYFEVAHRNGQPFKVQKGDMCVTVLGTHFNVNSYGEEPSTKVTLLQGSVKVNKGNEVGMLQPGQQASLSSNMQISNADVAEAIAWKEGKFQFGEAADITSIMRQLSRWYNFETIYQGDINGNVGGSISRDLPVSQVLKMLEMTGMFTFRIEGNKVLVKERQ